MIFSENIYFLILFTLPATLNIIYNAHLRLTPVIKDDKSVELAECVFFCFAVFCVNILIYRNDMKLFIQYSFLEGDELKEFLTETNFDHIDFMINYFGLNLISSVGVLTLWYLLIQRIVRWGLNKINKILKRPEEFPFADCWNNIFETGKFYDCKYIVIRIKRSNKLVTAGYVGLRSGPRIKNKEILLYDTDFIKQQFIEDENVELDQRMFGKKVFEYYDFQSDVLIEFYDSKKYEESCF